jgi:V/A-type H+-transporting ATPase subunit I
VKNYITLIDPLKNPLSILVLALALGIIQIFTGIVIKLIRNLRLGYIKDAIFDQVFWLCFLVSLGVSAWLYLRMPAAPMGIYFYGLTIVWAGCIVATGGRGEKKLWKRVAVGLGSLYGIVDYISDTLSYSRLLALALATTVIGIAVNMIAFQLLAVPYVGVILTCIILVIGHIFNLALSVMGAFVHSLRLQYVEFFKRFYSAGGEVFKPFCIMRKYVTVGK